MKPSQYIKSMKDTDELTQLHDWSQYSRVNHKLKQTTRAIITQIEVRIIKIKNISQKYSFYLQCEPECYT